MSRKNTKFGTRKERAGYMILMIHSDGQQDRATERIHLDGVSCMHQKIHLL